MNAKFLIFSFILTFTLGSVLFLPMESNAANDPWIIDVAKSGDWCVRTGDPVVLWRANDTAEQTLKVTKLDRSWLAEASWPAGFFKIFLSPEITLYDDDIYVMEINDIASHITIHLMPQDITGTADQAKWLLDNNCTEQLKLLSGQ